MNQVYWDTSALLKIYVVERDSEFFLDLIEKADRPVCTSVISTVEIRCALSRKKQAGDIDRIDEAKAMNRFTADCMKGRITQLSCNDDTATRAKDLVDLARGKQRPIMIRSLNALHLASAMSARAPAIVTTDMRMREVAALLRLKLIPGTYSTK